MAMEVRSELRSELMCLRGHTRTNIILVKQKKGGKSRDRRANNLICSGESQILSAPVDVADCANNDSKGDPLQAACGG